MEKTKSKEVPQTLDEAKLQAQKKWEECAKKREALWSQRDGLVMSLSDVSRKIDSINQEMAMLSGQHSVLQALKNSEEAKRRELEGDVPQTVGLEGPTLVEQEAQ